MVLFPYFRIEKQIVIQQQPMNSSSAHLLPQSFPATPLNPHPRMNPLTSTRSLAPFSLEENPLRFTRSPKHRMTETQSFETTMFETTGERRERNKRLTLPNQTLEEKQNSLRGLLSPTHLARLNPKISFTYRNPTLSNTRSQVSAGPPLINRHITNKIQIKPLIQRKGERCKLSSNQFSFSFVPNRTISITDYNSVFTSSIKNIVQQQEQPQEEHYMMRTNSSLKIGSQSKVASTIASSGFPYRSSDFSHDSTLLKQHGSESGLIISGKQLLLDSIPSKELGKTIMLPSHYTFGGIIEQSLDMGRPTTNELQARQWRNHFGLLGGEMKESIHCGPEQRIEHHFSMLGGYGREIKQSTISFCE